MSLDVRNICIIAHVDHGKTTLVDHLLKQAGTYQSHEVIDERVMDSDDQERERGITISAKNASFRLGETKVNIVDTPGHADFGGEVERIMGMVDGAILLVDAAEGPLPQTRFVLDHAIKKGLRIVLCINKVDRPEVSGSDLVEQCINKVFDLFVELGASDEQCDFPIVYACARDGWCCDDSERVDDLVADPSGETLAPLFKHIMDMPAPTVDPDAKTFSMLISNLSYSDYLGALAIGRINTGSVKLNENIFRNGIDSNGAPVKQKFQVTKLLTFDGLKQSEAQELQAGDIGVIAGCDDFEIGDTLGHDGCDVIERIEVEAPTMRMIFSINSTPNSGKEGKTIQSRELRDRLLKEVRNNVALRLEDGDVGDQFYLLGRGELQFGIIIEKLRREGLEFMVGKPNVLIKKDENGNRTEPFERVTIDLPEVSSGEVTQMYQQRKGALVSYEALQMNSEVPRVKLIMEIPTRGILSTNSKFKTLTRGAGLISSEAIGYRSHQGEILHRQTGSLIADRVGKTTAYALFSIQQRGLLFVGEGVEMYEGMIIGENSKENDINVNACKPKKLTNVRSVSSDGITVLQGTKKMSLEQCIEWIDEDEWIEVTPKSIRLRKKVLPANERSVRRGDRIK